jgi:cell division protein ZapB
LDIFQSKLEQLSDAAAQVGHYSASTSDDLPLGLGLEPGDLPKSVSNGLRWLEPDDARNTDPRFGNNEESKFSFPTSFKSLDDSVIAQKQKEFRAVTKGERDLEEAVPVYTLPENSTLIGSVAMTALLGRVPINGTVTDPYPFKVLVGKDNLIANGLELPDVEGAIMSGSASGDWTLSCVRGNIHSITFVFRDGTIRTVPESSGKANNNGDSRQSSVLGWLSDPHGLPCIPGEKKSNAAQYLGSQFLLSGSAAAAEAFANGQTTNVAEGGNITSAITGSSGKFVMGQAMGGGLKETSDWFKQRYGQVFDAVYVPPGHQVAIHITRQIPIDYEEKGRKIKYNSDTGTNGELD